MPDPSAGTGSSGGTGGTSGGTGGTSGGTGGSTGGGTTAPSVTNGSGGSALGNDCAYPNDAAYVANHCTNGKENTGGADPNKSFITPDISGTDVPAATANITSSFAGWRSLNFAVPTGTCPAIKLDFDIKLPAGSKHFHITSDTFCSLLEKYKTLIQTVLAFGYIFGAIMVVFSA